jgi:hypothetical protein
MMRVYPKILLTLCVLGATSHALAQDPSASELAKKAQNPIASMISLPIQSNINYNLEKPDITGDSSIRLQLQFMFPK